jgi:hypothetical protein
MFIPTVPQMAQTAVEGALPVIWYGLTARDGDASPWKEAPIGSIYIANVSGTLTIWVKDAANVADADWGSFTIST